MICKYFIYGQTYKREIDIIRVFNYTLDNVYFYQAIIYCGGIEFF